MRYGLKENDRLIAVQFNDHFPKFSDFGIARNRGSRYVIVAARIREIGQIA